MADQQIDELSLKVEVKQKNVAKDIDKISAAIDKLTSSLKGMKEMSSVLDKLSKIKLPSGIAKATSNVASKAPELKTETITQAHQNGEPISSVDMSKTNIQLEETKKTISGVFVALDGLHWSLKANIEDVKKYGEKISEVHKTLQDGTERTVEKWQVLNNGVKYSYTITDGVITQTKTQSEEQKKLATNIDKTAEAQKKLNKEQGKSSESTKKSASAWSKLTKSIGRIALYRTIRTAIKNIAQTWTEGLQNFAQYNEETNKAMSDVKNSFTQVKNTLGVTAGYLMQTLAPIITSLSDTVVGLLDNINMALAKIQGKDYFSKAKKGADDYAASLKKAKGQLASFDTFTTLGGGTEETSPEDMFEKAEVAAEWNDTAETFASIIDLVQTLFQSIKKLWEPLKPLVKVVLSALETFVKALAESFKQLLEKLVPVVAGLLEKLVPIIIDIINIITPLLTYLVEDVLPSVIEYAVELIKIIAEVLRILLPTVQRLIQAFKPILNIIQGQILKALNVLVSVLDFISPLLDKLCDFIEPLANILEKIFNFLGGSKDGSEKGIVGKVKDAAGSVWKWVKGVFGFANGGSYETGDFFKANENGTTELIASTNTGGSVMNIDQWESISYSSFYRALADYNAAQNGQNVLPDINTLGRGIAASQGFINEANRRNPALKLR